MIGDQIIADSILEIEDSTENYHSSKGEDIHRNYNEAMQLSFRNPIRAGDHASNIELDVIQAFWFVFRK